MSSTSAAPRQPWLDPELAPVLELIPSFCLDSDNLARVRTEFVLPVADVEGVDFQEQNVPGPDGGPDVVVLVARRSGAPTTGAPGFLWIHGGGYVLGSPDGNRALIGAIVQQTGCVVVSPAYRLAPETPFPGAHEDCYAALAWMHRNAATLGVDPARIAIGGASAGGGLAAALALMARDRGEVPVVLQVLVYPMLDDRTVVEDTDPLTGQYVWNRTSNAFGWRALLNAEPGGPDVPRYAAAARADDLDGLPPTFMFVGQLDLFREEDLAYADRLMRAAVPTEVHLYPGAFHGFDAVHTAGVARRANAALMDGLRRAFTPPAVPTMTTGEAAADATSKEDGEPDGHH